MNALWGSANYIDWVGGEDPRCIQYLIVGDPNSSDAPFLALPASIAPSCSPHSQNTLTAQETDSGFMISFSGFAHRINVPREPPAPFPNDYDYIESSIDGWARGRFTTAGTYTVQISGTPSFTPAMAWQDYWVTWSVYDRVIECRWSGYSNDYTQCCDTRLGSTTCVTTVDPFVVDIDVPDVPYVWTIQSTAVSGPSGRPAPADISISGYVSVTRK